MKLEITEKKFYKPVMGDFMKQSHMDQGVFDLEVSFAIQQIQDNNFLSKCTAESFKKVILNVAQSGLSLNPTLGYAYIVPRYNRGTSKLEACMDTGYRGYIKLLMEDGELQSLQVNLIYEGDEIDIDMATEKKIIRHIPYLIKGNDKGEIIGGYSLAKLASGDSHIEIMSKVDIIKIRNNSESYKSFVNKKSATAIWHDHFEEMARKTIIRRHWKYLPKGDHARKVAEVIAIDDSVNAQITEITTSQYFYADNLIEASTLSEGYKTQCKNRLEQAVYGYELDEMFEYLNDNQPNLSGSAGDAAKLTEAAVEKDDQYDESKGKEGNDNSAAK